MIKILTKNEIVRSFDVVNEKANATLSINGKWITNPTMEQLYADGWEDYTPPAPEEPTKEQQYKWRVVELIREQYTMDDELALHRQRETKLEEFDAYNNYCEECKAQAHKEIYGEE